MGLSSSLQSYPDAVLYSARQTYSSYPDHTADSPKCVMSAISRVCRRPICQRSDQISYPDTKPELRVTSPDSLAVLI